MLSVTMFITYLPGIVNWNDFGSRGLNNMLLKNQQLTSNDETLPQNWTNSIWFSTGPLREIISLSPSLRSLSSHPHSLPEII